MVTKQIFEQDVIVKKKHRLIMEQKRTRWGYTLERKFITVCRIINMNK